MEFQSEYGLNFISVWTKSTSGVSIWVWAQFWLSLSWDLVHIQLTFSLYIGCSTIIWYPNMCAYKLFSPSPYFWVWPHVNRYHAVKIWTPLAWSSMKQRCWKFACLKTRPSWWSEEYQLFKLNNFFFDPFKVGREVFSWVESSASARESLLILWLALNSIWFGVRSAAHA